MRKTFNDRLEEINQDVILMGNLVQEALYNAVKAFTEMNTDLAQKVIDGDEEINESDMVIEEKCVILQAGFQPVARDLRYLHSVSIIIKNLERIGDLAVNISKIVQKLVREERKHPDKEVVDLFNEMGNLVKTELNKAIESFKNKDIKLALRLRKLDEMVNEIHRILLEKLFSYRKDEKDIEFVTNIVLASRYLERIGDQSVNIAERVMYFLSGDYKVLYDSE
ncbi:MAG: phosphate signaling complex protein PhoU [Candidatus Humimicrobiaceae bacterium]|nr:phosphate signaling complex protein PhoU [Actinomycetota bacterium]MDY0027993.1 phosphate signaling complex protein PhoU [Candidatus Humimicrobiaceae bacterium]